MAGEKIDELSEAGKDLQRLVEKKGQQERSSNHRHFKPNGLHGSKERIAHRPEVTSHRPEVTSHRPEVTPHRPEEASHRSNGVSSRSSVPPHRPQGALQRSSGVSKKTSSQTLTSLLGLPKDSQITSSYNKKEEPNDETKGGVVVVEEFSGIRIM